MVLGIEPLDNKSAAITLVDYGVTENYNIFTDYTDLSGITYDPGLSRPSSGSRTLYGNGETPTIIQVYSGTDAIDRLSPGIYRYTIRVIYVNLDGITSTTSSVECQYNFINAISNNSARSIIVPFNQGSITIPDVREGQGYRVRLRYLSSNGATGPWTPWYTEVVQ